MQHAQAGVGDIFSEFKNASAFLLRGTRHACMTNYLCVPLQSAGHPLRAHPSGVPMVCLGSAISDGGLTPTTDTKLLLAAYRDGSHLPSDIKKTISLNRKIQSIYDNYKYYRFRINRIKLPRHFTQFHKPVSFISNRIFDVRTLVFYYINLLNTTKIIKFYQIFRQLFILFRQEQKCASHILASSMN